MKLLINDRFRQREVSLFNQFRVNMKHDAIASTFELQFYFNPDIFEHKEMMCIGHYHECQLIHNDEVIIKGQILSQNFPDSATKEMVAISGYSLTGVLEDVQIPTSMYPLQSDGLSLAQIARKLVGPFGLQVVIDNSVATKMNQVFDTTTAEATQSIKDYLTELATQKNIVVSHTPDSKLYFTSAKTDVAPLLTFSQGMPGVRMALAFNGQGMHSHITVVKQADEGNAGEATIRNPYVINTVYRPTVVVQSSGDDNDTVEVAANILASELRNLSLVINIDRWVIEGKIIRPNQTIRVINPEVYLYKESTWFIESVTLTGDESSETATLTCVLPDVYNGKRPAYLFKGINLHAQDQNTGQ